MTGIATIMTTSPVIPVLIVDDAKDARALAQALVAGGLKVLEVTMRTPAAIKAIREMKQVPGAIVGAGTVMSSYQFDRAIEAGAEFIVSPGLSWELSRRIIKDNVPYLPGVATASDIMRGLELGLSHFKFFPAEAAGGLPALKALSAPFSQCKFCPTGGITEASAPAWLSFGPVLCVGGSWMTGGPPSQVQEAARRAAALLL